MGLNEIMQWGILLKDLCENTLTQEKLFRKHSLRLGGHVLMFFFFITYLSVNFLVEKHQTAAYPSSNFMWRNCEASRIRVGLP